MLLAVRRNYCLYSQKTAEKTRILMVLREFQEQVLDAPFLSRNMMCQVKDSERYRIIYCSGSI